MAAEKLSNIISIIAINKKPLSVWIKWVNIPLNYEVYAPSTGEKMVPNGLNVILPTGNAYSTLAPSGNRVSILRGFSVACAVIAIPDKSITRTIGFFLLLPLIKRLTTALGYMHFPPRFKVLAERKGS
jgi:hypothetical protein